MFQQFLLKKGKKKVSAIMQSIDIIEWPSLSFLSSCIDSFLETFNLNVIVKRERNGNFFFSIISYICILYNYFLYEC